MESYLVHKQYYCAARHSASGSNPSGGSKEAVDTSPPPAAPPAPAAPTGDSSDGSPPPRPSAKVACVQCGVEFESLSTLQTHRMFYCSKRDASGTTSGDKINHTHSMAESRKITDASAKTTSTTPLVATPSTTSTNNGIHFQQEYPTALLTEKKTTKNKRVLPVRSAIVAKLMSIQEPVDQPSIQQQLEEVEVEDGSVLVAKR